MCGIAGLMRANVLQRTDAERDVPAMARALTHRGPDDEGVWLDADAGVALCHRRLSIIDLSPLGHQPMISASGRYVIVFNGEIYNYLDLRRDLVARGAAFRGTSDTEVLLAAIEAWGVAAAIERAQGMFAIALWDRHERELFLARDRFGEKPLYYGICNGVLLFGSELKALREHASWDGEIDRDALSLFMQHDFIPAPFSIFKRIRKVRAGAIVSVRPVDRALQIAEHRYWRPEALFDDAARKQRNLSPEGYVDLIEAKLGAAVRRQMVADVPLGAFLSGGTDSSLVVALMQHASTQRVKTFSIGFAEREYDESPFARAVAAHLRTDHSELIVTPGDCLDVIPKLPHIYDEPFADSSQIPTYLVASLARRSVTVALSGDGGDELFAGYGRYRRAISRWQTLQRVPASLRASGSALISRLPRGTLEVAALPAGLILGQQRAALADKLSGDANRWRARSLRDFYRTGLYRWSASSRPVLGANAAALERDDSLRPRAVDDLKQMMHFDACEYLPDDILVKVDRAAMAVSLETRVPMLDPEVAIAAWEIPSSILMHDGKGKWVLRELLQRYVPRELVERPKKGFSVPIAKWLRAELRPWAADLLDPQRLRRDGYLDAAVIHRRWTQHLGGRADWSTQLWNALMFQSWFDAWEHSGAEPGRKHAQAV